MKIKPISLQFSILIFGSAAFLFLLIERIVVPFLANRGLDPAINFLILGSPHILFFIGALLAYKKEGNDCSWKSLCQRFRIFPIKGKFWFWVILFVIIDISLYLLVYKLGYPFVKWVHDLFPTPEIVLDIMGDRPMFVGRNLSGNWWLLGLFFFRYFFNVVGEEFLWRGYLFPRQELTHGKNTWIVHGLLWTGFHLFAPYNALMVLPGALFMSYIVQRYKNNTIFIISHAVMNGIPMVGIIQGIIN